MNKIKTLKLYYKKINRKIKIVHSDFIQLNESVYETIKDKNIVQIKDNILHVIVGNEPEETGLSIYTEFGKDALLYESAMPWGEKSEKRKNYSFGVKPKNFKYIIGYIDNVAAKNKSSLLIEHKTLVEYIPHSLYGPSIIRRDTRTTRTMKLLYPKLSTTYIFEYFIMGELICQTYNFLENKQKNKQAHQLFKKQMIKYKLFGGKT